MTATTFDELYGSNSPYLTGTELGNRTLRVEIGSVDVVDLRQKDGTTRRRLVLSFPGQDKMLVLNKTNATVLAQLLGKDHSNWVGAQLELFTEPTTYGLGIRIRPLRTAPKPKPASQPASKKELNDDIPSPRTWKSFAASLLRKDTHRCR